jgi:hypothetical protein
MTAVGYARYADAVPDLRTGPREGRYGTRIYPFRGIRTVPDLTPGTCGGQEVGFIDRPDRTGPWRGHP